MDTSWLIFPLYFYWAAGFLFGELGMLIFGLAHVLTFGLLLWKFRSRLSIWRVIGLFALAYLICGILLFVGLQLLYMGILPV